MLELSDYFVDFNTGFLINQNKKTELSSYYDPWIHIQVHLESLMETDTLKEYIDKMPVLSIELLTSLEQKFYCHSILAFATSAYVWYRQQIDIPKILPKSLSVPLRKLSDKLGLMPILCHSDMVLFNTYVDFTKSVADKDLLVIKNTMNKNINWNIFQRETARVEFCFNPIIRSIYNLYECIMNDKTEEVTSNLKVISLTLTSMRKSMKNFNEMNSDYFHRQMRPFLVGWAGDGYVHKGGLLYENEDGSTTAIECIGGSAAQSPTSQVLDTLFKIQHSSESQMFFDSMKLYMIKEHRDFIRDVSKFIDLEAFIQKHSNDQLLIEAHNECINAISIYRTNHMQIVTKFIINPSKKMTRTEIHSEFLQVRGTGGQGMALYFIEYDSPYFWLFGNLIAMVQPP